MKRDNRCLYNSIRRRLFCPLEYTADHLKRQTAMFICDHKSFFLTYAWRQILVEYNQDQSKNFSFKDYLLHLLQSDTWGDELVLSVVSIMWNVKVSAIFPRTLKKYHIRHAVQDLTKVEVVVINTGGMHYSAVGKGCYHVLWVVFIVKRVATMYSGVAPVAKIGTLCDPIRGVIVVAFG